MAFLSFKKNERCALKKKERRNLELLIGNSLEIGLLDQHLSLPKKQTALEFLMKEGMVSKQEAHHLLVRFDFYREEVDKKISVLSSGQKLRLKLASFAGRDVNFLILDEPTNNLDMEGIYALKKLLDDYEGSVILVSHDRRFLEDVNPSDIYLLEKRKIERIDLEDYEERISREAEKLLYVLSN